MMLHSGTHSKVLSKTSSMGRSISTLISVRMVLGG
jgi:hypothetical protein